MSYFALLDCNNFYVSCERLFNPRLEGKPVIVLSNNDGCVVARSQEAKQLKIAMGVPYFEIRDFCIANQVEVFSSNYPLYGDLSQRVMDVLMGTGFEVEIYSIDEAFLKFPDDMPLEEAEEMCVEIRRRVRQWVGLPTSIGLAPTKTLAKLANHYAKQVSQDVLNLCISEVSENVLEAFPVEDVWGIGRNHKRKLNRLGIYSAKQFRDQDPLLIKKEMGVVGERMLWELRGLSCLRMDDEASPKDSITCSRSFGKRVTDRDELAEALATYANTACIKLRQQESFAQGVYIFLESVVDPQTEKRRCYSFAANFPTPTQDTSLVIAYAKKCLAKIYQKKETYKKCGVILFDLVQQEGVVDDLFKEKQSSKRSQVMEALDSINQYFGKDTVFFAAMGTRQEWRMRSNQRSPLYTTSWSDLALAKAEG